MLDTTNMVGQRLGKYKLIRLLGEGGFARVYLGEHEHLQTQAAIKVLRSLTPEKIDEFKAEARTIARLTHPNIVRVLDFDVELPHNIPFLVMAYARGTLRQRHPRGSLVPLHQVVFYISQIAEALQYAHDEFHLIHRDVKPENMLLGQHNEIQLSDFGIALVAYNTYSTGEQEKAAMKGTILYMAPEQVDGKPRLASDQYALAIVAYEWLCGYPPFRGTFIEVATQQRLSPPPLLSASGQHYPHDLEEVLRIALSKDPKLRFDSVSAFARALAQASRVLRSAPILSLQARSPVMPVQPPLLNQLSPRIVTPVTAALPLQPAPAQGVQTVPVPLAEQKRRTLSRRKLLLGLGLGVLVVGSTTLVIASIKSTASPHLIYTYKGHDQGSAGINDLAWSPDGKRIASGGFDATVQVWDALSGKNALIYKGHTKLVTSIGWSPDGKHIASSGGDMSGKAWDVQVWNPSSKKLITKNSVSATAQCLVWSPDSKKIVYGDNNTLLHVWNIETGTTFLYQGHTSGYQMYIVDVAWSPDGTYIASACDDRTVKVWDAHDGKQTFVTHRHANPAPMWAVACSPSGTAIASGDNAASIEVWEARSGKLITSYTGHTREIIALAWSPSSQLIASASNDGTVQVWRATDGQPIWKYPQRQKVFDVNWSYDGQFIASCGQDNTVQVWQAPTG